VALDAYRACPEAIRPEKLYYVRFPLSWSRQFVQALRGVGIEAPGSAPSGADAGLDVHEIGVADALATAHIDVREYIPIKLAAVACHASQWPPDHFIRRMPRALADKLWAAEFFSLETSAGSAPLEDDLFEGLPLRE
jgi:LmbE family N-acetylglucosaminyl deacetylase